MYPSQRIESRIIEELVEELGLPEATIEAVRKFQGKTANEATKLFNTIELTDLGVFCVSASRVSKKITTLEKIKNQYQKKVDDTTLSDKVRETNVRKVQSMVDNLNFLNSKLR